MHDVPSVEVTDEALGDVARQLDPDSAWSFTRLDMLPALEALAARWPDLPEVLGAPGRRYTADGFTVPLFHLLVVGPDEGPITVYAVDTWAPDVDQCPRSAGSGPLPQRATVQSPSPAFMRSASVSVAHSSSGRDWRHRDDQRVPRCRRAITPSRPARESAPAADRGSRLGDGVCGHSLDCCACWGGQ